MNLKNILIKYVLGLFVLISLAACSDQDKEQADEHFKAGRYEEAVQGYSQELQTDPSNVQLLYSRGRAYEEMGRYEEAIEDFKTALKYDDRNVRLFVGMGDALYKQGKFENALYYYEKATDFETNNPLALFKEGRAHHKLGNVSEAKDLYDAALREDPMMGEVYMYRAALNVSQDNKGKACEDFQQAKTLNVKGAEEAFEKYCN